MASDASRAHATRRRFVTNALLVACLPVVLSGWLLAAPPGASPDDGYHLASIWCAEGFKEDRCLEDPSAPDLSRVLIPFSPPALLCFQHQGLQSAACALDEQSSELRVFSQVKSSNIGRERPNLYYLAMHQLIGESLNSSLARMRVANISLASIMVLLTALVAPPPLRRAYLLSSILASVPLGLFLVSSLNTSAWGLIGLSTAWVNGLTAIEHPKRFNRLAAVALTTAGIIIALGSRSEAVVHIGIMVLALLTLRSGTGSRGVDSATVIRRVLLSAALIGTTIVSLVTFAPRSARLADVVGNLSEGYERLELRGIGDPLLAIAFEVPSLWTGALGHIWGLGALDTPIPTLATLPLAGAFLALLTIGLQGAERSRFAAALLVGGSLFVFPTLALLQAGALVYEQLQPRQFMALLYLILGLALYRAEKEPQLAIGRGLRVVVLACVGIAHAVAHLVTARRHISGLTEFRYVSFSSPIEWWWATGPSPTVVWAITSTAFVIGLAVVLWSFPLPAPSGTSNEVRGAARRDG